MKDVTNTIRRAVQADGAEIVAIDDIARGGDHVRRDSSRPRSWPVTVWFSTTATASRDSP